MNDLAHDRRGDGRGSPAPPTLALAPAAAAAAVPFARASAAVPLATMRAQLARDLAGDVVHARGVRDLGREAGDDAPIRVSLLMRAQHEDELRSLVAAASDARFALLQALPDLGAVHRATSPPSAATYARTMALHAAPRLPHHPDIREPRHDPRRHAERARRSGTSTRSIRPRESKTAAPATRTPRRSPSPPSCAPWRRRSSACTPS